MYTIRKFTDNKLKFDFQKYLSYIVEVIPKSDLVGIEQIRVVDKFSNKKCSSESLAYYFPSNNGQNCIIEIHLNNIIKESIPKPLFVRKPEIAAFWLSEIVAHEIGHHVHHFKRHGIKKTNIEDFAEQYAKAAYYYYFRYRKSKILSEYKWGSLNFFRYTRSTRKGMKKARIDLIAWFEKNREGIPYP